MKDVTGHIMYSTAKDHGNKVSVLSKDALGGDMLTVYQYNLGQLILSATLLDKDKVDEKGRPIQLGIHKNIKSKIFCGKIKR